MDFCLQPGVNLHVIPTKHFKLTHVLINFATPQTNTNATSRNLLANLLETSTHLYPTQTALARQLAKLYGAYVTMMVGRIGRLHTVRLKASFVNDRYADQQLFSQVVDLIDQVLFHPLIEQGEFDSPTFRLQVNNLASTIKSLYDDKQFYAHQKLCQLYYQNDSVMQTPSFGRLADLPALTPASLVTTYQQMIERDRVDIFVLGDVDPTVVRDKMMTLPFVPRPQLAEPTIFYEQGLRKKVLQVHERQRITQAKLNMAYQLPVYYRQQMYYPAVVFNGLFGGSPYSKLFTNVREKASLAYYASSRLAPFNGLMTVQTGIQAADHDRVLKLINQQLTAIQQGDFDQTTVQEIKDAIINQQQAGKDLATNVLEHRLVEQLLKLPPIDNFADQINAVTNDEIMAVASLAKLQSTYLLSGEKG